MERETVYNKVKAAIQKTNPNDWADYMKNFEWAYSNYSTARTIEQALRATVSM